MRWLSLFTGVLLSSCTAWDRSPSESRYSTPLVFSRPAPDHPLAKLDPDFPVAPAARPQSSSARPPAPSQPKATPRVYRTTRSGVALTFLLFDDRDFSFAVADKARGPETQWQSAQAAARDQNAVAAINASFFTPEGHPLGLVIENGARFGSWSRGSSLTSGVFFVNGGNPHILRREQSRPTTRADHLVQAGPFLLENARTVSGLSNNSARPRSFLAWDQNHHWVIGHARSATLANLARALASQPLPEARLITALNLDGGRSSDLWVSSTIKGGPVSTRSFWNKPVRNYVLVRKRSSL